MLTLEKRGKVFHAVLWADGTRFAGLWERKTKTLLNVICYKLDTALRKVQNQALWWGLEPILPSAAFARFSEHVGFKDKQLPTWSALQATFNCSYGAASANRQVEHVYCIALQSFPSGVRCFPW